MRILMAFFIALAVHVSAIADDLLIFSAKWCGPCQQLKAAIEKDPSIVADYDVALIDIDDEPDTARQYRVRTVPTLIAVKEDGNTRRKVGFTSVADLKRWLSRQEEYQRHRFLRRQ